MLYLYLPVWRFSARGMRWRATPLCRRRYSCRRWSRGFGGWRSHRRTLGLTGRRFATCFFMVREGGAVQHHASLLLCCLGYSPHTPDLSCTRRVPHLASARRDGGRGDRAVRNVLSFLAFRFIVCFSSSTVSSKPTDTWVVSSNPGRRFFHVNSRSE